MDAGAAARFPLEERRAGDDDVCMSDRLVPSRGTCSSTGHLKLERDENWAPRNEYHEVLSKNVLGKESLSNAKVLSYRHKPARQEAGQNEFKVLFSNSRDGAAKPRAAAA